jgi:hypothetical protein
MPRLLGNTSPPVGKKQGTNQLRFEKEFKFPVTLTRFILAELNSM